MMLQDYSRPCGVSQNFGQGCFGFSSGDNGSAWADLAGLTFTNLSLQPAGHVSGNGFCGHFALNLDSAFDLFLGFEPHGEGLDQPHGCWNGTDLSCLWGEQPRGDGWMSIYPGYDGSTDHLWGGLPGNEDQMTIFPGFDGSTDHLTTHPWSGAPGGSDWNSIFPGFDGAATHPWSGDVLGDPGNVLFPPLPGIPLSSSPNFHQELDDFMFGALDQLAMVKEMERALGIQRPGGAAEAQRGDFRVIAGNRTDGVKARRVTIHEQGDWSSREHHDNTAGWGAHESLKQDATLGTTYQVTVEWEDGTSTVRNVNFHTPGQVVVIDSAW